MSIVIYHNPKCGTSRNVLGIIREFSGEPTVVEYIKTGWARSQLLDLFASAGITPREALRTQNSPAKELGLLDSNVTDDAILDAMVEHSVLVNRPIVSTPNGTKLCRPAETAFALINTPSGTKFTKENGEVITAP